ncbi:MAG: hypothetical protein SF051_01560 [Elusimicrobiota bacterium]|nr:hypothetical protein [Elusimicrobiota bacterium]
MTRLLILLLACRAAADDGPKLIDMPPPPKPIPVEDLMGGELVVPAVATWEGKPVVGGRLAGKLCDGDTGMPEKFEHRTDYKGRATMKFLVSAAPKPGWSYAVCLTLYGKDGAVLAESKGKFVVGSSKPVTLAAAGRMAGAGLDAVKLDERFEVDAVKALKRGSAQDRAIAASLMAKRRSPPLSLIPAAAAALEGEYDAGAPEASKHTRQDLVEGLRRYRFYHEGRSRALRRAAAEDPDERLRKLAESAPSLKP